MEIAVPVAVMPDYFEKLQAHILQEFAEGVAAWGESVTALARWEEIQRTDLAAFQKIMAGQNIQAIVVPSAGHSSAGGGEGEER